jgi:hypothetical protein
VHLVAAREGVAPPSPQDLARARHDRLGPHARESRGRDGDDGVDDREDDLVDRNERSARGCEDHELDGEPGRVAQASPRARRDERTPDRDDDERERDAEQNADGAALREPPPREGGERTQLGDEEAKRVRDEAQASLPKRKRVRSRSRSRSGSRWTSARRFASGPTR